MITNELCMACMQKKTDPNSCSCGWHDGQDNNGEQHLPAKTYINRRYVIGNVLGAGGFGVTYIGYDVVFDRRVAIKEFLPKGMVTRFPGEPTVVPYNSQEVKTNYEKGLQRFLNEARTLAQLNEKPGIVQFLDFQEANGTAYLIMQYLEGETLKSYIARSGGRLTFPDTIKMMLPVMDALKEVHNIGLLHRDISPDNIYVCNNGDIKVLDFGAARYSLGDESHSLSVVLKHGYAPFEQYSRKGKQGPWTDIYAFAATVYRCLTGEVPLDATDRMVEDSLVPPSVLGVNIPPEAEAALLKALAVRPEFRYQHINELQEVLIRAYEYSREATVPISPKSGTGGSMDKPSSGGASSIGSSVQQSIEKSRTSGASSGSPAPQAQQEAQKQATPEYFAAETHRLQDQPQAVPPVTNRPVSVSKPGTPDVTSPLTGKMGGQLQETVYQGAGTVPIGNSIPGQSEGSSGEPMVRGTPGGFAALDAAAAPPIGIPPAKKRSKAPFVAVAVILLLAIGGGVFWAMNRDSKTDSGTSPATTTTSGGPSEPADKGTAGTENNGPANPESTTPKPDVAVTPPVTPPVEATTPQTPVTPPADQGTYNEPEPYQTYEPADNGTYVEDTPSDQGSDEHWEEPSAESHWEDPSSESHW